MKSCLSEAFEGGFDDVFDAGLRVFLEDGRHDFVNVGLGKAQHDEGGGGFIDDGAGIDLQEDAGVGTGALDDLVLELQDQTLSALEADALDTLILLMSSARMAFRISSEVSEESIMRAELTPMPETPIRSRKSSLSSLVAKP